MTSVPIDSDERSSPRRCSQMLGEWHFRFAGSISKKGNSTVTLPFIACITLVSHSVESDAAVLSMTQLCSLSKPT
ncbi:hypothetical protein Agabi119p4_3889 [Agaricus bisporus var. burnettii]|uniref:Uncharacterized protein n=1 Tax=Agaricus bisporus var. burnettii TaxID=192524 RepID=A0A8H7KIJ3_AGABI|nr:hypothetical protein Agabi119p4_3889 [Agaricus bisporus var. burnettii]